MNKLEIDGAVRYTKYKASSAKNGATAEIKVLLGRSGPKLPNATSFIIVEARSRSGSVIAQLIHFESREVAKGRHWLEEVSLGKCVQYKVQHEARMSNFIL